MLSRPPGRALCFRCLRMEQTIEFFGNYPCYSPGGKGYIR